MSNFVACAACQSPIKEGQLCAVLQYGSVDAGGEVEVDETAEEDVLCLECADTLTSLQGQMREGRY